MNNPTDADLKDVAQWLRTTVDDLEIEYQKESIENYKIR